MKTLSPRDEKGKFRKRGKTYIHAQNEKYKITVDLAPEGYDIVRSFLGGMVVFAEEQWAVLSKRYWFFGWHWESVGFTNSFIQIDKWKERYFPEILRDKD